MGFSTTELMIILAIVLVLFGANKIPQLAKGLGKGIKDFKNAVKDDEEKKEVEETTANTKSAEIKDNEEKKA
jgi:sec-independent protein translocase protein TatA